MSDRVVHDNTPDADSSVIDASPTKEFFIYMLIRDVPLTRAIIDLVDNCVDGAMRETTDRNSFAGFWIKIDLRPEGFWIRDNCGGIPVDVARDYAFRFGRPSLAPNPEGSIGQFGVGMKRTIFKLGAKFFIRSTTASSRFTVEHDVEAWTRDEKQWSFAFSSLDQRNTTSDPFPEGERGTEMHVTNLYGSVADQFALESFAKQLAREIEIAHCLSIQRGLRILVNGVDLEQTTLSLLSSEMLRPAKHEFEIRPSDHGVVRVTIVAGVTDERSLVRGGWYVFCNSRLVLNADQSPVTGWEVQDRAEDDELSIPKYHPDFAYFRGYVFFESAQSSLLPWTTTKTGVDVDSAVYKATRLHMMRLLRPVLDFLRRLASEKSARERGEQDNSPLEEAVREARTVTHASVEPAPTFTAPPTPPRRPKTTQRIQYDAKITDIGRARARLGNQATLREIGERTFSYFLHTECDD